MGKGEGQREALWAGGGPAGKEPRRKRSMLGEGSRRACDMPGRWKGRGSEGASHL